MKIDLLNVDENGQVYAFDRLSDETKGVFNDLIGEADFKIGIQVKPLGNSYQILGQIESQYLDVCSQCGEEISVPLVNKINEILVIEKKRPRNTQVSQSQQSFDPNDPSVTYLNEPSLQVPELLHELMAAALPSFPSCTDRLACEERQKIWRNTEIEAPAQPAKGHPAFAALKELKLKH